MVPVSYGSRALFFYGDYKLNKVIAFVDGFNLYHSIKALNQNKLKWLDLRSLCVNFAPSPQFLMSKIFYFSAYATWLPGAYQRHKEYVKALESTGVTPIMGKFKEKDRSCNICGSMWKAHEEKETDVNIALYILDEAYQNSFDRALIISADSDLSPAVRLVKERFPSKTVRVLTPVNRKHSWDLVNAAGGLNFVKQIKKIHIERSLLPENLTDSLGNVIATRPKKYDPPV